MLLFNTHFPVIIGLDQKNSNRTGLKNINQPH